jgi:hypothetical protein
MQLFKYLSGKVVALISIYIGIKDNIKCGKVVSKAFFKILNASSRVGISSKARDDEMSRVSRDTNVRSSLVQKAQEGFSETGGYFCTHEIGCRIGLNLQCGY